jgi:hypothetical protein
MGVFRLQVHPPQRVTPAAAERAYFTARDRFLLPIRTRQTDEGLVVERSVSDSGFFHIPWQVEGRGELTLGTAWLMERQAPYQLQVELARGKINQIRNQMAEWQAIGLIVPDDVRSLVSGASAQFSEAATAQHDPPEAARRAERAICTAAAASEALARCYCEQATAARIRTTGRMDTLLGVNVGASLPPAQLLSSVAASSTAVCLPLNWRQVEATERAYDWRVTDEQLEWAMREKLFVCGGPVISFGDLELPAWLTLWEGDYENVLACVGEFVERAARRYRGRFQLWHAAARLNVGEVLGLTAEERLRIAVRTVEIISTVDPDTPVILSFDQPWAEYMNREDFEPPLYLADTLVRAGLGLAGIGLELNFGYYPGGSYLRDALDLHQLIDFWNLLGLPLHVFLTLPSSGARDDQAQPSIEPVADAVPGGWTPAVQQQWLSMLVPQLLTRPAVRSICWHQLRDAEPHRFPHGGLFAPDDRPKPALATLQRYRGGLLS